MKPIWELVIEDMKARHAIGLEHYGKALYAGDEVDKLQALYEELLDAASYIRAEIEERKARKALK